MLKLLNKIWDFIQELIGEKAYEKYLEHQEKHHPGKTLLSRKEFEDSKWDGVRRCC